MDLKVNIKVKSDSDKIREFNKDLRSLDKQYNSIQRSGKEYAASLDALNRKQGIVTNKITLQKNKLDSLKSEYKRVGKELYKTKIELKTFNKMENVSTEAVAKKQRELEKQEKAYRSLKRGIKETTTTLSMLEENQKSLNKTINIRGNFGFANKLGAFSGKLKNAGESAKNFGNAMLGIGIPIVYGTKKIVDSAISFESAFAGVRKTTNATEKEYKALSNAILDMSTKMPQSAENIAKVAEVAGQLGISKNGLLDFTQTMIMLGDSTNLSAEEGATAIAQFKNVVKLSDKDVAKLGSSIVELGNNFATTEKDILNLASRMAGTGAIVGMSSSDILGFATALSSVGVEAEMGGSSFSKLLTKMQLATSKGGKALKDFANVSNVSTEDFKKAFKNNATQGVLLFIDGLAKLKASGGDVTKVLNDMGFSEVRLSETIKKMVGASGEMHKALNVSNKAWKENTALVDEANKRYSTSESKLAMAKNELRKSAITLGKELLPQVNELLKSGTSMLRWFNSLSPSLKKLIINFGMVSTVIGGVSRVFGSFTSGVGSVVKVTSKLSKTLNMTKEVGGTTSVISKLTSKFLTLNPVILGTTAAVGALGYGLYYGFSRSAELGKKNIIELSKETGFFDKALVSLKGQTKYTTDELVKMGFVHKELDGVSTQTRENINKTSESFQKLALSMEATSKSNIFDEKAIKEQFDMVDSIVISAMSNINKTVEESKAKFSKIFTADGKLSEDEVEALRIIENNNKNTKTEIDTLYNEIKVIRENALKNHKILSDKEVEQVKSKLQRIAKLELESKGLSHEELIYAEEEFKAKMENISLEQASNLLKQKREGLQKDFTETETAFNAQIRLAEEKLNTLSGAERKKQEEDIEKLKESKVKVLDETRNHYNELLNIMKEKYPEMVKEIDIATGKILTVEDKAQKESLDKFIKNNNLKVANQNGTFADLKDITESGNYVMYSTTKKQYELMRINVDKTTKSIRGIWDITNQKVYSATEKDGQALKKLNENYHTTKESVMTALLHMADGSRKYGISAEFDMNTVKGALEDVKIAADGTQTGILELNKKKIQIKINKYDAIMNLKAIRDQILNIPTYVETKHVISRTYGRMHGQIPEYFTGTNYSKEGFAEINEKGWELFDSPELKRAKFKSGGYGYLSSGTRVTNHLASTQMMKEDIKKEVQKQFDFRMPTIKTPSNPINSGVISTELIQLIVKAITDGFNNAKIENVVNVKASVTDREINKSLGLMNLRDRRYT